MRLTAKLQSRSDDQLRVGVLAQAVCPGDGLSRRSHVRGNLQEKMSVRAVGLGGGIDHLDGSPGIERPPDLAPENSSLI